MLSTFKLVGEDQAGNWSREVDYIWMGRRLLGTEDGSGVKKHYHTDHLGSIRLVTDSAGNKVSEHEYLPYGQELTAVGNGVMKFTGHERDSDTGMDYMHARFYTSYLGRFTGADSVLGDVGGATGSWNRYQYGLGNPMRLVDPNGMNECGPDKTNVQGYCVDDTSTTVNCSDTYDPSQCAPPPECGPGTVAFRGSCRGHSQNAMILRDSKDPWNGRSRTVDLGRAVGANLRAALQGDPILSFLDELLTGGDQLPDCYRQGYDGQFLTDLSRVSVHRGLPPGMNSEDAQAITLLNDIFFTEDRYDSLESPRNEWLVAHELAHVDQAAGRKRFLGVYLMDSALQAVLGRAAYDDNRFERAAESRADWIRDNVPSPCN